MNGEYFTTAIIVSALLWLSGMLFLVIPRNNRKLKFYGHLIYVAGLIIYSLSLTFKWLELNRPLFRTTGETLLWFSAILGFSGYLFYFFRHFKWLFISSVILSVVPISVIIVRPENFDFRLNPSLNSPWFIVHSLIYIVAYSILTIAAIVSVRALFKYNPYRSGQKMVALSDRITFTGIFFLTLGLLSGAIWAKEAWGHYWTWDPKETLSLISWLIYVICLHLTSYFPSGPKFRLWAYIVSFIFLIASWTGILVYPEFQGSVHMFIR